MKLSGADEVEEVLPVEPPPPADDLVLHHRRVDGGAAERGEAEPGEQHATSRSRPRAGGALGSSAGMGTGYARAAAEEQQGGPTPALPLPGRTMPPARDPG